ncbi:DNA-3-methyladenine glycosylase [Seminavis robusta]|uniref:DNA-3-methyladenine glycosylase n=1 Tax=Seminavis robusta TaxID=568900 RepID=A0A9N8HJW7_9STRA|nr:DNA-3-methyladenine glycosylase [Seminavis robusta]|eukprot:Sro691_g187940.1 DNA-3-methyladenine glycosylase (375) ;mRNA; f:46788-47912
MVTTRRRAATTAKQEGDLSTSATQSKPENVPVMPVARQASAQQALSSVKEDQQEKMSSASSTQGDQARAFEVIHQLLQDAAITTTMTKAGWCLRQGMIHITTVDNGRLFNLVQEQGPPSFYHSLQTSCRHEPTDNIKAPDTCFQSLCRIIAGQQLAGKAAQSIWKRLLETVQHNLTPSTVLQKAAGGRDLEDRLQKPAGLSRAKARSVLDLAQRFEQQELSEDLLLDPNKTEDEIRQALLKVKGLGPWSCDMFIMFHLEKPNVFPFGDLGVRKGVAKVFEIKNGKGKHGSLCQKKDLDRCLKSVEPYHPYQSLMTYYMWRAADIKDVYGDDSSKNKSTASSKEAANNNEEEFASATTEETPAVSRKRKARTVTP